MPKRPPGRAARTTYRHGNLRAALLAEAVRTMNERADTAFTLREVAQRLGVSHSAAYRHFPSKGALLAEIACEGFHLLQTALEEADTRGGKAEDVLRRQAAAYVRVALGHPAHFRCMFGPKAFEPADLARVDAAGEECFGVLLAATRQLPGVTADSSREADIALALWSIVHGVAHLAIDGHLDDYAHGSGQDRYAAATDRAAQILLAGIRR